MAKYPMQIIKAMMTTMMPPPPTRTGEWDKQFDEFSNSNYYVHKANGIHSGINRISKGEV